MAAFEIRLVITQLIDVLSMAKSSGETSFQKQTEMLEPHCVDRTRFKRIGLALVNT